MISKRASFVAKRYKSLHKKVSAYRRIRDLIWMKFIAPDKVDILLHRQVNEFACFNDSGAMDSFERALRCVGERERSEAKLQSACGQPDRDIPCESVRKNGITTELLLFREIFGVAFSGAYGKVQPKREFIA